MNSSRGNVLFLILIAVALFAALSYAVTSSSRSGGAGNVSKEKAALMVSQLEQYSASLSTTVTRMTLSGGVTLDQIGFECVNSSQPYETSDSSGCSTPYANWSETSPLTLKYQVFHPTGGNIAPLTSKALGIPRTTLWDYGYSPFVSSDVQIHGVGSTDTSTPNGTELTLLLPDIPKAACTIANEKAQISGIPVDTGGQSGIFDVTSKAAGQPFSPYANIGNASSPQFYGKFSGCMELGNYPGHYIYYSVITAR